MSKSRKGLRDTLKPIFFPVEKVPASDYIEGIEFNDQLSHWIISTTNGEQRVVNACSRNYHLISNEELLGPLIDKLESMYKVDATFKVTKGARFYIDFVIKDLEMFVMKNDRILPRLRVNNSYDGSVRYGLFFGFWREICTNGLMGIKWEGFKLRHTPGTGAQALPRTIDAIEQFMDDAPKILKTSYEPLVKRKLTQDQAAERIQEIIDNTKLSQKKAEPILQRLSIEQEAGLPLNEFLLYNAINYVLYNDGSKMKQHKKDKLDEQILTYISNH